MSHPMEGYYDGIRAERDRLRRRRVRLETYIATIPLSRFTVAQLADLVLLIDGEVHTHDRKTELIAALDRLEIFLNLKHEDQ